jgi:hypothetical protein
MIISSKLTTGLAWTGLAVVLAVPSADFLTTRLGGGSQQAAVLTSTTDPVKTGSINKTAAVDKLSKTGKPLPDYISDPESSTKTVSTKAGSPAVTVSSGKTGLSISPIPTASDTTTVATAEPAPVTPPVPFPARPVVIDEAPTQPSLAIAEPTVPTSTVTAAPVVTIPPVVTPPPVVTTPAVTVPTATTPTAIAPVVRTPAASAPSRIATANPNLVVVDDNGVASTGSAPVVAPPTVTSKTASVSAGKSARSDSMVDDSANWKSETLRQYLTKRGILEDMGADESTATVTESDATDDSYDADGNYIGPKAKRAARRASMEELLNQQDEGDSVGFNLF